MLISNNIPAFSPNVSRVKAPAADTGNVTFLAPGDAYVPSQPNEVSVTASGAAIGLIVGGGAAALVDNLTGGFGGAALAVGLVVAGGIGGGFAANKAFEASQK